MWSKRCGLGLIIFRDIGNSIDYFMGAWEQVQISENIHEQNNGREILREQGAGTTRRGLCIYLSYIFIHFIQIKIDKYSISFQSRKIIVYV